MDEENFEVHLPAFGLTILLAGAAIVLGASALTATGIVNLVNQPWWVLGIFAVAAVAVLVAAMSFIYPIYLWLEEKIKGKKPESKPSKEYTIDQIKRVK
ncbi:Uncharacterised protein [Candidatus Gugararchaeum adminiculabundum]|nr:Uncharacterised protein [Candidatus Gugararchaeum adminiculabundum]